MWRARPSTTLLAQQPHALLLWGRPPAWDMYNHHICPTMVNVTTAPPCHPSFPRYFRPLLSGHPTISYSACAHVKWLTNLISTINFVAHVVSGSSSGRSTNNAIPTGFSLRKMLTHSHGELKQTQDPKAKGKIDLNHPGACMSSCRYYYPLSY
jgi:hypothetical protein